MKNTTNYGFPYLEVGDKIDFLVQSEAVQRIDTAIYALEGYAAPMQDATVEGRYMLFAEYVSRRNVPCAKSWCEQHRRGWCPPSPFALWQICACIPVCADLFHAMQRLGCGEDHPLLQRCFRYCAALAGCKHGICGVYL